MLPSSATHLRDEQLSDASWFTDLYFDDPSLIMSDDVEINYSSFIGMFTIADNCSQ